MAVLVLTRPNDGTAGGVVAELERRGIAVVRGDVGDFPIEVRVAASMGDRQEWQGSLYIAGNPVSLSDIRAIYYRRPTGFRFPEHLSPEQQRFAKREARRGLGGINPNGQWGWIEERTSLPITSAMADLLTREAVE
jgi:hypothetical protein